MNEIKLDPIDNPWWPNIGTPLVAEFSILISHFFGQMGSLDMT
jgi:hypothetical protein